MRLELCALQLQEEKIDLIKQRLEQPEEELDVDQALACLDGFISLGLEAARKSSGKDVVVAIGNTGAGTNSPCSWNQSPMTCYREEHHDQLHPWLCDGAR